jgi:hypothetical protein
MKTTLNKILKANPCGQRRGSGRGWDKLLTYLGKEQADDEELSIRTILESNGIYDAIWVLRAVDGYDREMRLFAADCAESVLHIYEKENPRDDRPRKTIQAARDYANGLISNEDLHATLVVALGAAWDSMLDNKSMGAKAAARAAAWTSELDSACSARAAAWISVNAFEWASLTSSSYDGVGKIKELLLKYI